MIEQVWEEIEAGIPRTYAEDDDGRVGVVNVGWDSESARHSCSGRSSPSAEFLGALLPPLHCLAALCHGTFSTNTEIGR